MYGSPSGVSANSLPRHSRASRRPVRDRSARDSRQQPRSRLRNAPARSLCRAMRRVFAADKQPPVVGPPKVVIRAIGVPRHRRDASRERAAAACVASDVGVLHPEAPDEPAKFRRGVSRGDDDARRGDRAARRSHLDSGFRCLHTCAPATARKSARPGERPRQEIHDTPARIHLRVARRHNRGLRSDARHPIQRCRRQPAPGQSGRFLVRRTLFEALSLCRGSSVKYTESHSQRPTFIFSARMVFARSRVARASDIQTSRVAARPKRPARSPKSRSGSCISNAVLATVLPRPTTFRFHQRHAHACFGEQVRADRTGDAATDDDDVDV